MSFNEVLDKLPAATDSWACKWFWLICYLSATLVALGITVIPGVLGVIAMLLGTLNLGFVIGMRDGRKACGV